MQMYQNIKKNIYFSKLIFKNKKKMLLRQEDNVIKQK